MKSLSVVIPVYNEEKTLEIILKRVLAADILNLKKEIVVIDDGSQDRTRSILKKIKGKNLKIVYHKKNMGKGAAVRTGIKNSTGDIILIQDADLEYHPEDYPKLIRPFLKNNVDVVYGSRELSGRNRHNYFLFHLGGQTVTRATNLLFGSRLTDVPTCYKAFRREVISSIPLRCKRFEFCPEVTAKVLKKKIKIVEVPIRYSSRTKKEGKKIKFKDGLQAIWTLIYYRFRS
jgi:glycosyltransferase involved in cell wall biosynthesis